MSLSLGGNKSCPCSEHLSSFPTAPRIDCVQFGDCHIGRSYQASCTITNHSKSDVMRFEWPTSGPLHFSPQVGGGTPVLNSPLLPKLPKAQGFAPHLSLAGSIVTKGGGRLPQLFSVELPHVVPTGMKICFSMLKIIQGRLQPEVAIVLFTSAELIPKEKSAGHHQRALSLLSGLSSDQCRSFMILLFLLGYLANI